MRKLSALDLFNVLSKYSKEELKEMEIVLEVDKPYTDDMGNCGYAEAIEDYPSQIQILSYVKE